MRVELNEAIKIYAKACRSWYGARARNVALERARQLRTRGDTEGFAVWQKLAGELEHHQEGEPEFPC